MPTPERLRELADAPDPRAELTDLFFLSPGEGVTDLLLIRHAQIEASTLGHDHHLTALGREQAEVLVEYLSRTAVHAVYASPTARAVETAEPVARRFGLAVETDPDLRDVDVIKPMDKPLPEMLNEEYGPAEGPRVLESMRDGMTFAGMAPFLEPGAAFRARVAAAIDAIIKKHEGGRIVVVTHAPVIMSYVAETVGTSRDLPFNPKLTSITRILARNGRRTLDYANARPHFEPGAGRQRIGNG
jgi:2,3-bisphosphoglycerate-dependent phosphoglycerate mutase